jgi:hypothetical protein
MAQPCVTSRRPQHRRCMFSVHCVRSRGVLLCGFVVLRRVPHHTCPPCTLRASRQPDTPTPASHARIHAAHAVLSGGGGNCFGELGTLHGDHAQGGDRGDRSFGVRAGHRDGGRGDCGVQWVSQCQCCDARTRGSSTSSTRGCTSFTLDCCSCARRCMYALHICLDCRPSLHHCVCSCCRRHHSHPHFIAH